jgi:GNAT superfamily N-acetyltransferase
MTATEPPALVLRDAQLDGPEGLALVEELQQEYVQRYGSPDDTPVDPSEFAPPTGGFLVAELDGVLIGCAGVRRGLARVLLAAAENRALELGYRRLILETGSKQPEAVALYQAQGYEPHENVGHYRHSDLAQMYVRDLRGDGL